MAKTNRGKQSKKPARQPQSTPPRNPIYLIVVGLLAAGWVIWRFESSQGLGVALLIGGGVFLAWAIFVVAITWSQRQGGDND